MSIELDIMNHVLSVVGEAPVSSYASTYPSAVSARNTIARVDRKMQSRGWWYNTEWSLNLLPDNSGNIILPSNTLKVDAMDPASNLVRRGTKLYDPVNHTFNIGAAVVVNLIVQLPIEELPDTAITLLQEQAAYEFYVNDDGDEEKANRLLGLTMQALAHLHAEELRASDVNSNNRPAVQRLRSGIQRYGSGRSNPNILGGRS